MIVVDINLLKNSLIFLQSSFENVIVLSEEFIFILHFLSSFLNLHKNRRIWRLSRFKHFFFWKIILLSEGERLVHIYDLLKWSFLFFFWILFRFWSSRVKWFQIDSIFLVFLIHFIVLNFRFWHHLIWYIWKFFPDWKFATKISKLIYYYNKRNFAEKKWEFTYFWYIKNSYDEKKQMAIPRHSNSWMEFDLSILELTFLFTFCLKSFWS